MRPREIPEHLAAFPWYAPHQAWLRVNGQPHHDPVDAFPRRADLRGVDFLCGDLHGAMLQNADLRGASLDGADVDDADLQFALIQGASAWNASFRRSNLSGSRMQGMDLHDTDLERAILRDAQLRGASLVGCDLSDADLRGAFMKGTDLRHTDLHGAVFHGAMNVDEIPRAPLPGLASLVLAEISQHPENHNQSFYHSECGTRHCCAGWAVVLAGDIGRAAEARLGTHTAAALLLGGTDHPFAWHDDPLPWLRNMADLELNGSKP